MKLNISNGALALVATLCAGALAATPAGQVLAQQPSAAPSGVDLMTRFGALESARDPRAAHAEAITLTRDPRFAGLSTNDRARAWALASWLALQANDADQALLDIEHAVSPTAPAIVWRLRLAAAVTARRQDAAIESLATLLERSPSELAALPDELVMRAVGTQAPTPKVEAAQEAMAEALLAQWRPQDPFYTTDGLMIAAVRARLKSGRTPAARALASDIAARDAAILLRADRRYDGLTADSQWTLPSPREAAEAKLAAIRILRARHPRRLSGAMREAQLLELLNADAEALQVVEQAIAAQKSDPKAFDDVEATGGWLEARRAALLTTLGRSDASIASMKAAAATREHGGENVSNVLNLSVRLAYEDPKEAIRLTELAAGRQISDYGRAVGLAARTCAYAHLNDTTNARSAFSQLQALEAKGVTGGTTMNAAWCLGDEATTAQLLIAQLADPTRRASAIINLQDVPSKEGKLSAEDQDDEKMMRALAARADVQAALAPYGRVVHFTREDLFRR